MKSSAEGTLLLFAPTPRTLLRAWREHVEQNGTFDSLLRKKRARKIKRLLSLHCTLLMSLGSICLIIFIIAWFFDCAREKMRNCDRIRQLTKVA